MRLVNEISTLFSRGEKIRITLIALVRVSLVALDLVGIVLVGAVASLIAGTNISPSSLFGRILGWLDEQGIRNSYALIFGAALLFFIAKGIFSVLLIRATSRYVASLETKLAERVFSSLLSSGSDPENTLKREDAVFAVTHSVSAATTKAILVASAIVSESALLLIISAFLAFTNFWLFLEISLFFGLVAWLLHRYVTLASGRAAKAMHESLLRTQGTLFGALDNRQQVFLSRNQKSLVGRFISDRSAFSEENARYQTLTSLPRYVTELAVILGGAILVGQRSLSVEGNVTAPVVAIFIAAIFRIVASMVPIQAALGTWKTIEFEAQSAISYLNANQPVGWLGEASEPTSSDRGRITLEDVSYSFGSGGPAALEHVNLILEPGTFVGIIGPSGSGKSTFADLLLGLKKPSSGSLQIDGKPLAKFLRAHLGYAAYVPQAPSLFPGTLRENVSLNFGDPLPGEIENVERVLNLVGLDKLRQGESRPLELHVGVASRALSGGEIQRIGLARALFEDPKLLVLDEVTSALDRDSETQILETIMNLKGRVTLVVIAHKLGTLDAADEIYKVDGGGIVRVNGAIS